MAKRSLSRSSSVNSFGKYSVCSKGTPRRRTPENRSRTLRRSSAAGRSSEAQNLGVDPPVENSRCSSTAASAAGSAPLIPSNVFCRDLLLPFDCCGCRMALAEIFRRGLKIIRDCFVQPSEVNFSHVWHGHPTHVACEDMPFLRVAICVGIAHAGELQSPQDNPQGRGGRLWPHHHEIACHRMPLLSQ